MKAGLLAARRVQYLVQMMAEWTVVHWVVMSECNLVEMKDATKVEMSVDGMVGLKVVH